MEPRRHAELFALYVATKRLEARYELAGLDRLAAQVRAIRAAVFALLPA